MGMTEKYVEYTTGFHEITPAVALFYCRRFLRPEILVSLFPTHRLPEIIPANSGISKEGTSGLEGHELPACVG
jgi:hypothetical protein